MSNIFEKKIVNRLRLSVSTLAVAAVAIAVSGTASAQTVLTSSNTPWAIDAGQARTVELTSGSVGYLTANYDTGGAPAGSLPLTWGNGSLAHGTSCLFGGCVTKVDLIQVDQGAKLIVNDSWGWQGYDGLFNAKGDVEIKGGTPNFLNTNYFLGNLTIDANTTATMGQSWTTSDFVLGPNTNLILSSGSALNLYMRGTFAATMGGALSGSGALNVYAGSIVINGANTAANPYTGTLTLSPGASLVVGDSAHTTAVFGDPGHPTANTLTIKGNTSGAPILRGFGTIYENVANIAGVVQPGYGTGTLGTLTVQSYTQDATGTLKVEVNPTSVSGLHVLGNAAINGSLNVAIDAGSYATKVYNIVQVDGTMTGSFTSITTSSAVAGAIAAVTKTANGYQVVTEVVQGAAASAPIVVGHLVSANRLNNYYLVGSLYDQVAQDTPRNGTEVGHNKYVWLEGFGRHSSVSRNDVGNHTTTEGFTAGAEYRTEANATVGLAASYSTETLKAKGASTADIDTWHVAAYGGANLQNARIDGVLFYNGYTTTAKRDFGANGLAQTTPGGYAYGASVQVSRSMLSDLLTPYVRGIFTRQHLDKSVETGAALLNLRYSAINDNTFAADVGFRINPQRWFPESKTKLLVTVALEHDFSSLGETVLGTFPVDNGQNWSSYWRGDSENTAIVGIDVARKVTDQLEVTGRVNGRASLFQTSGEISLGARYRF